MKKILLVLFGLLLAVAVSAQSQRVYNQNIQINKASPLLDLQGLGAKIYLDGATSGTATLQPPAIAGTTAITLPSVTGTLTNGIGITASLTAAAITDVNTTIAVEPLNIKILTSGGRDITSMVSDSVALSAGTYHLYIYSVDALANVKIKLTYQ